MSLERQQQINKELLKLLYLNNILAGPDILKNMGFKEWSKMILKSIDHRIDGTDPTL